MRSVVVGLALPVCLASMTKVLPKGQLPLIARQDRSCLAIDGSCSCTACMSGRTWRGGNALRWLHTTSGNSSTAERLLEAPARSLSAAGCLPVQKFCILQPQIILSMFVTSPTQRGKFRLIQLQIPKSKRWQSQSALKAALPAVVVQDLHVWRNRKTRSHQ